MIATNPLQGDEVFDISGNKFEYVSKLSDGRHVVSPYYISGDGEEEYLSHEVFSLDTVYKEPPISVKHEKIAELDVEISERREQLRLVHAELDEAGKNRQQLLKKLQTFQALKRIEDFIDGKFTYFIEYDSFSFRFIEANKSLKTTSSVDRLPMKLLTLFGATNGNLQWKINAYSDGSGSSKNVIPVETEREAMEIIQSMYKDACSDWRELPVDRRHYAMAIHWSSLNHDWIQVPEDIKEYLLNSKKDNAKKEYESALIKLNSAKEAYINAGGEVE